jgi:signal transduction histidine kinase
MCRFGTMRVSEQGSGRRDTKNFGMGIAAWKKRGARLEEREMTMGAMGTAAAVVERKRVEAVVETVTPINHHGEVLAELAHDARNMLTALSLYCDLLEEPGVLTPANRHYGSELRLLAGASRRLVEKLSALDGGPDHDASRKLTVSPGQNRLFPETPAYPAGGLNFEHMSGGAIDDLGEELLASRDLLAAIAGPSITLTVTADGGDRPVAMSSENLIRILVNLVRNAAESIYGRGSIALKLGERRDVGDAVRSLLLSVEDTGYGIPEMLLERVFEPGFTPGPSNCTSEAGPRAIAGSACPSPARLSKAPAAAFALRTAIPAVRAS